MMKKGERERNKKKKQEKEEKKKRYLRLPTNELPYKEEPRYTERGRNKKGRRGRQKTDRDEIRRHGSGELREKKREKERYLYAVAKASQSGMPGG